MTHITVFYILYFDVCVQYLHQIKEVNFLVVPPLVQLCRIFIFK
jgi:hypothetical protein